MSWRMSYPDEGQWRIDVAALLGELDGMTA